MAITATISSNLPQVGGVYYQFGNAPVAVRINVSNSSPSPVTLKQIYLTQDNTALGTGAGLSLGEPTFRYIGSSLGTTNNVIAGNSSYSYDALFVPQVNALTSYAVPESYNFKLSAVVQEFGSASSTRATPATFLIEASAFVGLSALSQYYTWSLTDNARPPNYVDFDFQVRANRLLKSGEVVASPINQLTFTSSNPAVATIVANSPAQNSDASGNLTPSGGCVKIIGVGSTIITADESGYGSDAFILNVVDALPQSLAINPPNRLYYVYVGMPIGEKAVYFKAYLTKSNGAVEDITNSCTWTTNNIGLGSIISPGVVLVTTTNSALNPYSPVNLVVTATYGGLKAQSILSLQIKQPV